MREAAINFSLTDPVSSTIEKQKQANSALASAGAVGHGALYHSQSPEAYFCHTPGLKVATITSFYTEF